MRARRKPPAHFPPNNDANLTKTTFNVMEVRGVEIDVCERFAS